MNAIDIKWPACGERRREVRKNPRNQYEQKLAESLRGGKESFYRVPPKQVAIYQWNEPGR